MSIFFPAFLPGAAVFALDAEESNPPERHMSAPAPTEPPNDRRAVDDELLRRMARRDPAAFSALYDRFSRPLYATALRMLNDAHEAEDIVQDVFEALWKKASAFEAERGSAFSWAITLTRNRAIDRIRMRKRRSELLAASVPEDLGYHANAGDSADDLWLKEKAGAVRGAVAALPGEQQRALELAFFSGLTQQQIATLLREPLGTVKARIRRGLLKMRETLTRNL